MCKPRNVFNNLLLISLERRPGFVPVNRAQGLAVQTMLAPNLHEGHPKGPPNTPF